MRVKFYWRTAGKTLNHVRKFTYVCRRGKATNTCSQLRKIILSPGKIWDYSRCYSILVDFLLHSFQSNGPGESGPKHVTNYGLASSFEINCEIVSSIFLLLCRGFLITSDFFYQIVHYLLDKKMLKFISKYYKIAPTCLGLLRPSSGSFSLNLAKVTLFFIEIISKITSS